MIVHGNTCANLAPSLCFAGFPCVTPHNENEKSYKYVGCDTPSLKFEYRTFVRLSWKKTAFRAPATSQKRNFLRDFLQKAIFLWTCVTKYCAKSTKKYDLILICILPFLYFPFLLCAFSVFYQDSPTLHLRQWRRLPKVSVPANWPRSVSLWNLAGVIRGMSWDVVGCWDLNAMRYAEKTCFFKNVLKCQISAWTLQRYDAKPHFWLQYHIYQ